MEECKVWIILQKGQDMFVSGLRLITELQNLQRRCSVTE